jgi:hypothetical protein
VRLTQEWGVACRDGIVTVEDLPFPLVHYPGHYGWFFGFRETEGSDLHLCSCSRVALEAYLTLVLDGREVFPGGGNVSSHRSFILDSVWFPFDWWTNCSVGGSYRTAPSSTTFASPTVSAIGVTGGFRT